MRKTIASFVILSALFCTAAPVVHAADDKVIEEGYVAVAGARTKVELALRKARAAVDENDTAWHTASAGADAGHDKALALLARLDEAEARKAEEAKDQIRIDKLVLQRAALETDWKKFVEIERPALETRYRRSAEVAAAVGDTFNALMAMERVWKDGGIDLAPLEKSYDATAKRAGEAAELARKALGDLQAAQKTWEKRSDSIL